MYCNVPDRYSVVLRKLGTLRRIDTENGWYRNIDYLNS
jgi:hypothetical protein